MSTHLMKEVLDTRYFYISIEKDFSHVINTVLALASNKDYPYFAGNPAQQAVFDDAIADGDIVFDIREMKITSDCTPLITNAIRKGIKFIDSLNERRNRILVENNNRCMPEDTVMIPHYDPTADPVEYIRSLDRNVKYTLPLGMSNLDIAVIILATLSRPKLQFVIDTAHGVIFDTVAEIITISVLCNYTEFYYKTHEGIEIIKLENGLVYTQRRGLCSIAEACETGSLVPTAFGTEKLINNPLWDPLVTVCLSTVNAMHQSRPKTLREVLKGDMQ